MRRLSYEQVGAAGECGPKDMDVVLARVQSPDAVVPGARRSLARTGPEPFWPTPNARERRYAEWAVAHHPMPTMMRLVLRVVLLHVDAHMRRACLASDRALAARASLSPVSVRAILREAERGGLVQRGGNATTVSLGVEVWERAEELRRMWARAKRLTDLWVGNAGRLAPADDQLLRARCPELLVSWGDDEVVAEDEYSERLAGITGCHVAPRFDWMRAVVDAPEFARAQRRRSNMAAVKAVAFAVELLMDSEGRPFRWTSVQEVAALAGYYDAATARSALATLEAAEWLQITRRRGRRGGILPCLTAPRDLWEQWAREAAAVRGDDLD